MKVVRRSFVLIFAISVTCLLLRYFGNYFYGYSGMKGFPFAVQLICCIVDYLMVPLMVLTWIIAMGRKEDRPWASRVVAVYLLWLLLTCLLPAPSDLVLYGLRNRMMRDFGVEDLRKFAHDFDQLPARTDYLTDYSTSRKLYGQEDLPQTGLVQRYPFLTWWKVSPHLKGPSYIDEWNGIVDVRWGGPLGHWGFSVALNRQAIAPSEYTTQMLKVGDGVCFMSER